MEPSNVRSPEPGVDIVVKWEIVVSAVLVDILG